MADSSIISLADTLPFPILLVSPAQRVLHANSGAEALLGTGLVGRTLVTVLRQPGLIEAVEAVLAGQGRQQVRLRLGSQGRESQVLVTVAALAEGSLVLTFEDRTAVETAEAMRRDFVANVSHELRTPLTALMGFIETLKNAARDDPKARDMFLGIMEAEAGRMNRLVGDLLQLSRVEAEERVRPRALVALRPLLEGVIGSLRGVAERKGDQLVAWMAATPVRRVLAGYRSGSCCPGG